MITSDRVRLDGLIHQWEEQADALKSDTLPYCYGGAKDGEILDDEIALRFQRIRDLRDCAQQLRAALLVLGDARPHQTEEK